MAVYFSVTSTDELVAYMQAHIKRVAVLAQAVLTHHPSSFPAVDAAMLALFCSVHDRSKVDGRPEFLRAHGLKQPIANDLLRLWGQNVVDRNRGVIDTLNRVDASVEQAFFDAHGIGDDVRVQYQTLVSVADSVDRGMNRVSRHEEMGRSLKPASGFMREPELQRIARDLEQRYHALIAQSLDYTCERF